jgi:ATPase subunit of ABC transporter with duplicated ATPase domains
VIQSHSKKLREGYSNLSQSTRLFKEKEDKKKQANQLRTAIEQVIEEKVTKSKKRKTDKEVRFAEESEDEDDNLFAFHDAHEQNDSSSEEFNDIHLEELSLSSEK